MLNSFNFKNNPKVSTNIHQTNINNSSDIPKNNEIENTQYNFNFNTFKNIYIYQPKLQFFLITIMITVLEKVLYKFKNI